MLLIYFDIIHFDFSRTSIFCTGCPNAYIFRKAARLAREYTHGLFNIPIWLNAKLILRVQ